MDKILAQKLQTVVEAFAAGKAEEADAAIHEYICRKSQLMLIGEAEDDEDKKDDEKEDDKKDDEKEDDKEEKDDASDEKDDEEKDDK